MYMPSIFGESLFDNMFPFDEKFFTEKKDPLYGKNVSRLMKTDVRETETFYLGEEIREEEIKAKFENGILSVSIPKEEEKKVEGPKHISIEG